jgi:hypothetical protein
MDERLNKSNIKVSGFTALSYQVLIPIHILPSPSSACKEKGDGSIFGQRLESFTLIFQDVSVAWCDIPPFPYEAS